MAPNTQFSIAVHLMAGLGHKALVVNPGPCEVDSNYLALSINANPSFVRRVLAKLSKAGLVKTSTGKGGACGLARTADKITLLDIYEAVEAPKAFSIHTYPAQKTCSISCAFKSSLEKVLNRTQKSLEKSLSDISLSDFISDLKRK